MGVQSDANTNAASTQGAQIVELESTLGALAQQQDENVVATTALAAGAPSGEVDIALERMAADDEAIGALADTMFTWDSHDTYEAARITLSDEYNLAKDGAVLTGLMPADPVNVDAEGTEYPYIDAAGLNSSLGNYALTVTSVTATTYEYLVKAAVLASSTDGSTTASRVTVLMVTTDEAGNISEVRGWAAPTAARSAATGEVA